VFLQTRSITASKCISKLARSRLPSVSLDSLDYGLQVRTIMASKCISKLAQSRPPSASLSSLDLSLQVDLQTRSITSSKCISEFTITASMCISKLARLRPASSHEDGLQLHLETRSITASKCISEFTESPSPSASQTRSIKYIFKERRRLYGDTGVTEVDRVMGSIYSADRSKSRYSVCRWVAIQIHRYIDENTN